LRHNEHGVNSTQDRVMTAGRGETAVAAAAAIDDDDDDDDDVQRMTAR